MKGSKNLSKRRHKGIGPLPMSVIKQERRTSKRLSNIEIFFISYFMKEVNCDLLLYKINSRQ